MGLADLFGGGALRAEIKALKEALESAQSELSTVKDSVGSLKKQAASKEKALQESRAAQKKAQKKLEKVTGARSSSDQKTKDLEEQVSRLQSELDRFQQAMLDARAETEKLRARMAVGAPAPARTVVEAPKPQAKPAAEPAAEGDAESAAPVAAAPAGPRPSDLRKIERLEDKVERLEGLLTEARDQRDGLRDRVAKAEKAARDAEHRQRSNAGKAEAAVRDLQHNLGSERKAYRILQMQYEAQVDRVRGFEQQIDARVKAAIGEAKKAPAAAAPAPSAPRKQIAEVLEDAPVVSPADEAPTIKVDAVAAPEVTAPPSETPAEVTGAPAAVAPEAQAPMPGLPAVANTSPLATKDE